MQPCDTILLLMWAIEKNESTLHKVGNLLLKVLKDKNMQILQTLLHLRGAFTMQKGQKDSQSLKRLDLRHEDKGIKYIKPTHPNLLLQSFSVCPHSAPCLRQSILTGPVGSDREESQRSVLMTALL